MNIKEKNKKILARLRITPLDIALILFVLLVAISSWQKNNIQLMFERQAQEKKYEVVFEIEGARVSSAELLKEEAQLYFYDGEDKVSLGSLNGAIERLPYTQTFVNTKGETVTMVHSADDRENGRVTLRASFACNGFYNDQILVHKNGLRMQVGESFLLATEFGDFTALVVNVVELSQ